MSNSLISNEEKNKEFASTSNEKNIDIINDKEENEEYDPNQDAEQEQAVYDEDEASDIINDEELENDIEEIKNAKKEDELPLNDINEEDEEKEINSEYFESELLSAFESVKKKANFDGEQILSMVREQYMNETGIEVSDEMIEAALKTFNDNTASSSSSSEEEDDIDDIDDDEEDVNDVDPELFAKEMDDALDNVRKLGAFHQKQLVDTICGAYSELNGIEPTTEQIKTIFIGIKEKLLDEARDDFIEFNDAEDDDNDSDYNPIQDAMQQIELLEELTELKQEENDDDDDSDYNPYDDAVQQIESLEDKQQQNDNDDDDVAIDEIDENDNNVDIVENVENDNKKVEISVNTEFVSKFEESRVDDDSKEDEEDEEDEEDQDYISQKKSFNYSRDIEDDLKTQETVDI